MEYMLKNMDKVCFFSLGLLMFASCSEELGNNAPEPQEELVQVSFRTHSAEELSKSWYDQEGNSFYHTWNEGDEVNVFVQDLSSSVSGLIKASFKAKSSGRNTEIAGSLKRWASKRTLYAVHPYSPSYYDFQDKDSKRGFLFPVKNQSIDLASGDGVGSQSKFNSLFIAKEDSVGYTKYSEDDVDIDINDIYFRQAMSYFKLDLTGLQGYTLKSIKIRTQNGQNSLLQAARVSVNKDDENGQEPFIYTPEITGKDIDPYNSVLWAGVENHIEGEDATIYFALFPAKLEGTCLVVKVTDCDGQDHEYIKDLPIIDFKRNEFSYYPQPLNLNNDFKKI